MTDLLALNILLDAGVKSVVVLAVAGVMMACMRKRSAAARHLLCFLAVAGLPVLPVLSWALPGWRALPGWMDFHETKPVVVKQSAKTYLTAETSVEISPTPRQIEIAIPVTPEIAPQENAPSPTFQNVAVTKPAPARAKINLWPMGFLAWLAGVLLALVPVVLGIFSLHRLGRTSRRETAASWLELLHRLLLRLGFKRRVVLLKTAQRRMPMTWGVLYPKVLLPEESEQWPEDRRSVVLLHELAHAQRWDYLTHLITRLVCALYWFNPLVWLAARRMIAERERACDDIVLRHGAEPADYAEQVLEISAGLSMGWFAGYNGVAMARPSNLEGRLRAILDASRNRATVTWFTMLAALALLAAVVIPVAILKAAPADSGRGNNSSEVAPTNFQSRASAAITTNLEDPPIEERRVSISAEQKPLKDVLTEICRQAKAELELDADGLKLSGVSVDTPVTLKCQDEPLSSAVGQILRSLRKQSSARFTISDIVQDTRSGKLVVSSIKALTDRQTKAQPAWLNGYGIVGNVDDQTNIVSLYVGAKADDELLAKLKTLPKLRELDIEATKMITPAGLAHLAELPALEKLNLYEVNSDGDGLGNDAMPIVSRIKTLRDLRISYCSLTDVGLSALEGMTQLTALNLSHNRLTDAGMKSLAGLTNLQSLDVSDFPSTMSDMRITDEGMKQLSQLKELRELSIGGLKISGQTLAFPHLQSLNLSGNLVTDAALDSIVQCRELRQLGLQYTGISDEGMKRIATLKELRQLNLDSHFITDAGIAQLRALPKLEHVSLRATGVSDASLRSLAGIKSLTRLDLHGSGRGGVNHGQLFTMGGLRQLKDLPNLRTLWINNLELPDGYLGLRELKQLRGLTLFFCNIKDPEEELLQAAMPDTYISASSGNVKVHATKEPVSLPETSIRITGRAVDDESGQPIQNCTLEFGAGDPDQPGEIIWGEALSRPTMEVAGNDPQDESHFWGESFRPGKAWARLLESGYQPALLTPNPVTAPLQMTNIVVRLKRGGDLHGSVVDYQNNPLPGLRVYLADQPYFSIQNGTLNSRSQNTATTDSNGRFALPGGNGTAQKVVVATADGHMFAVAPEVSPGQAVTVTLPQPAALAVHYDIPDDLPVAQLFLNFESEKPDQAAWKGISFGLSPTVTNRGEIVLTNLNPGTYRLARRKVLNVGGGDSGRMRNERIAWLDEATLTLTGGSSQRVELVRPAGNALRGEVAGLDQTTAFGAYFYAFSDQTTNSPADMLNLERPLDATSIGRDGQFQTARLAPGAYILVAIAFKEPNVNSHNRQPDYFGSDKVIVTTNTAPPVKIELRPYNISNRFAQPPPATNTPAHTNATIPSAVQETLARAQNDNSITISGRVVDDATGQPLVDFMVQQGWTNDIRPGEVLWQSSMVGDARSQNSGSWTVKLGYFNVAARITAPGYGPEILQRDSFTNKQSSGLEIRLKRGEVVHGVVRDAGGKPVGGAKVYLTTVQGLTLMDGKFQYGIFRDNSSTTDESGRFELRGAGGPPQRVVVTTADNHLVWPIVQSGQGQAMEISLPKPGSLIVRYDIPGDAPEAKFVIQLFTTKMDMALWKDISFGLSFWVANGGQTILTNLAPGTYIYNFRRYKTDGAHGAENEQQTVVVEAGKTQYADMMRTNGQRIRGKVLGLDEAKASGGYIFVKSAEATGLPWPQRSRNAQKEFEYRTFDVSQLGADGTFQTAMLNPGTYTVVANVYPPKDSSQLMPYRNDNPDYVAVAKVTVTTNAMPPVTLKLVQAQYVDIAGSAVDDENGAPIRDLMIQSGKVNLNKPGEIIWDDGYQGAYDRGRILLWDQKEGSALRFRANGYVPQVFTRQEIIASRQTANLQVRLKRGGELHGVVLDHSGQPVAHASVFLYPLNLGSGLWLGSLGSSLATTDQGGRFSLRGVDANQTRVVVVTSDGQMVQPVQTKVSDADLKITMPRPATLIVRYDIPGDVAETGFNLSRHTNELEMPLWKYVNLKPYVKVPNGSQTVMTNLSPGTYDVYRTKFGGAVGHEYAFIFGDPSKEVRFDAQRIVLESGKTQQVSLVRSIGQPVQGQVTGMEAITNLAVAFVDVGSATAISNSLDFGTILKPCFDAVRLDKDGLFQTALLEPGSYTLVAEVYVQDQFKPHEYADDEPQYGGILWVPPRKLAYVGTAKVTVTANVAPMVKIELHPWLEPAKSP